MRRDDWNTRIAATRSAALLVGAGKYWGKDCPHGHHAPRFTNNRTCTLCHNDYARKQTVKRQHMKEAGLLVQADIWSPVNSLLKRKW